MYKNYIKIAILLLAIPCSLSLVIGCTANEPSSPTHSIEPTVTLANTSTPELTPTSTPEPTPKPPITLIFGATGDIMCHEMQLEDAEYTAAFLGHSSIYYFDHTFKYIQSALEYPDLMIGNLETVFAGPTAIDATFKDQVYTGFPYFNSPDEFFYSLVDAGFDVLTNANNHSYDRGALGIRRTNQLMDDNGIYHTGTYSSPEDRDVPLIIDVNGVNVGILSNTYGVQHSRVVSKKDQEYMLSIASPEYIIEQVNMLKSANADIIIASTHWGDEDFDIPNEYQRETAQLLAENGVDIIFGSHTHVLQPIEMINTTLADGTHHSTLVCWSLGNFIANTFIESQKHGGIAYAYVTYYPDSGEVTIDKCEFLPTQIYNDYSRLTDYHVLIAGMSYSQMAIDDIDFYSEFDKENESIYNSSINKIGDSYAIPIRSVPVK